MMGKRILLTFALLMAMVLRAAVRLGAPFTDGVVLQQGMPVRIWGAADPGERVAVRFAGQSVSAIASPDGDWRVELAPMSASKEPRTLTANGVSVKDVLVGEVWICSGQSNADCPLWGENPRYRDGWGAVMLRSVRKPFVRIVKTPYGMAPTPQRNVAVEWRRFTFEDLSPCKVLPSAMGCYYALELANALDVPIGLVDSSDGGTNIDAWTPRSGYEGHPELSDVRDWKVVGSNEWRTAMRHFPVNSAANQPTVLWNAMVAPYVPMSVRGVIWYQGCHNVSEAARYTGKLHALYDGWAKEFENPGLEFYLAQLASSELKDLPLLQEAQARFAAEEPHAALSVLNDVGNVADIHPNDKRTVAKRLSLHALKRVYGWDRVCDESPLLSNWKVEDGRYVLTFDHADGWYVYSKDRSLDVGFEVCDAEGNWKRAKIINLDEKSGCVSGADLIVGAEGIASPTGLRYLHSNHGVGTLYGDTGLPLGVFHIESREKGAVGNE